MAIKSSENFTSWSILLAASGSSLSAIALLSRHRFDQPFKFIASKTSLDSDRSISNPRTGWIPAR